MLLMWVIGFSPTGGRFLRLRRPRFPAVAPWNTRGVYGCRVAAAVSCLMGGEEGPSLMARFMEVESVLTSALNSISGDGAFSLTDHVRF